MEKVPYLWMSDKSNPIIELYDKPDEDEDGYYQDVELNFDENGILYVNANKIHLKWKTAKEVFIWYTAAPQNVSDRKLRKALGAETHWVWGWGIKKELADKILLESKAIKYRSSHHLQFKGLTWFFKEGDENSFVFLDRLEPVQYKITNYKISDCRKNKTIKINERASTI